MKKYVLMKALLVFILVLGFTYLINVPSIVLNGKEEVVLDYSSEYKEAGASVVKFGHQLKTKLKVSSNVDTSKLGEYKVSYSYNLLFLKVSKVRNVLVLDREKPEIILLGNKEAFVCPGTKYVEDGYKAIDNYDGDITSKVKREELEHTIIYSVKDSSGNMESINREIKETDTTRPIITLEGNETIYVNVGSKYNEPGYKAIDDCEGDITSKVVVTNNVNTSKTGQYEVIYKVSDSYGNSDEVKRKVIVRNNATNYNNLGVIYLTFDDGPGKYTGQILDTLKKYNVKATFFVTGKGSDSLILREYKEGHTVGLHTYSHSYSTVYGSVDNYFSDLNKISDRVKRITGVESKIIRFPGGSSNTVSKKYSKGIMTTLTKEVVNRGYKYYDWNISSGDAGDTTTSTGVYNNVIRNLSHSRPNMVLMHDIKSYTANAIESIIVYGLNNGYRFEAITYDTKMITQKVNN